MFSKQSPTLLLWKLPCRVRRVGNCLSLLSLSLFTLSAFVGYLWEFFEPLLRGWKFPGKFPAVVTVWIAPQHAAAGGSGGDLLNPKIHFFLVPHSAVLKLVRIDAKNAANLPFNKPNFLMLSISIDPWGFGAHYCTQTKNVSYFTDTNVLHNNTHNFTPQRST